MQFSWRYRILLALLLAGGVYFARSPGLALQRLAAVDPKTGAFEAGQVNVASLKTYSRAVLDAELKIRWYHDMARGDVAQALADYSFARDQLGQQSAALVSPRGLRHLLCGELARFPEPPAQADRDCWRLEGEWHWQSPTAVQAAFVNPTTGWRSTAVLQRYGLFDWRLDSLDLPVDAMFEDLSRHLQQADAA